jgi:cytochrome P450
MNAGQKFALMEEKVLISSVFRNFQVKSMESREDVKLLAELILRPKDGLKIQLKSKW